jgi:hypothetical protein
VNDSKLLDISGMIKKRCFLKCPGMISTSIVISPQNHFYVTKASIPSLPLAPRDLKDPKIILDHKSPYVGVRNNFHNFATDFLNRLGRN